MRSKKGFKHTINISGDYKPVKKLSDTVDHYNENYAPLRYTYNLDKKDYEKVKELMGEISPNYEMPRRPRLGSAFEMPMNLTRKDHKELRSKLTEIGINFK